jgi:hypothetical protein
MAKDTQSVLMQQVWRKALREGEVRLTLRTENDAKRMRFTLYNAVKAVREGKEEDAELKEALQECIVRYEAPLTVVILRRSQSTLFQDVAEQMGVSLESLRQEAPATPTVEIERSLDRLKTLLEEGSGSNPYYTREG